MSNRLRFATLTAVLPLALAISAAQAATPKETLVMAQDFADLISSETQRWIKVAREANIRID